MPIRAAVTWDEFNGTSNDPNGSLTTNDGVVASWNFSGVSGNISTTSQLTTGIDTTGGPAMDSTSTMDIDDDGTGTLSFSASVSNIQFRVNDFEQDFEELTITVTNNGVPVSYTISAGADISISGNPSSGSATLLADSDDSNSSTSPDGSALITIPGPADQIEFSLTLNGGASVDITDVYFTTCFTSGALILGPDGEIAIDEIKVGDLVTTKDAGPQPVVWIGRRHYTGAELAAHPQLRPIRIRAGSLGENIPESDLVVSPQHRVLVRSKIARRMFGKSEVLIAAKHLLTADGIDVDDCPDGITYLHLLLDEHHVLFSNGAETESLYLGTQALNSLTKEGREEIFTIFPELLDSLEGAQMPSARFLPKGRQSRSLVDRHSKNGRPLIMSASEASI